MRALRARASAKWIWPVAAALCLSAVAGGQNVALCISADGHLDLKHLAQSCHSCPPSGCGGEAAPHAPFAPAAPAAPDLPLADRCCLDIPLGFDLVGWLPAPQTEAGPDRVKTSRLTPVALPPLRPQPPSPRNSGPPLAQRPAAASVAFACLACTVLLL